MKISGKIIIRFFIALIVIFSTPLIYPKIKTINKEEMNPIIDIKDYGFKESNIYESLIGQAKFNDSIGNAYHLDLTCEDDSNSYSIDVMIYEWENEEIAKEHYQNEVENILQEYTQRKSGSAFANTHVPKISFDRAVHSLVSLDTDEWNIDEGYSTTDIHTEITDQMSSVLFVVIKDNQVMRVEYTNNLLLDSNNIQIFNDLLEQAKYLK